MQSAHVIVICVSQLQPLSARGAGDRSEPGLEVPGLATHCTQFQLLFCRDRCPACTSPRRPRTGWTLMSPGWTRCLPGPPPSSYLPGKTLHRGHSLLFAHAGRSSNPLTRREVPPRSQSQHLRQGGHGLRREGIEARLSPPKRKEANLHAGGERGPRGHPSTRDGQDEGSRRGSRRPWGSSVESTRSPLGAMWRWTRPLVLTPERMVRGRPGLARRHGLTLAPNSGQISRQCRSSSRRA